MIVTDDEQSQIEAARYSFATYAQILYPRIELAYHHLRIIFQLHQIEQGTVDRAMFFLPPRRGKTLLCSQLYIAWYLGKHPDRQVIFVSYNQQLADDSGRRVRDLINDPFHQRIFPECRLMEDSSSIQRLFFTRGGVYFAVGVGGPITGRGAHLLVIDDPIKDKEQARSDLERMKLHEWYSHVAYTRLMPKGAIVIINTRWHEDDLSGWLLHDHTDERWSVLSLPDIAEEDEPDFGNIKGRKEGEPLWPERFPLEQLHRIRNAIGSDAWNCLHQQRPGTREGNMFKKEWLDGQYKDIQWPARDLNKYILVDPASEKKKTSDYTAMMVVGLSAQRRYHVLDMVRDRLSLTQRADKLFQLADRWRPRLIGYEQYGLQADITYIRERCIQENRPLNIVPVGGTVGKIGRVERLVPLFEHKRVTLPVECWRTDHTEEEHDLTQVFVKSEYMSFPASRHDDMIDALARVVDPEFKTVFPQSAEEERMERQQQSIYLDDRSWLGA